MHFLELLKSLEDIVKLLLQLIPFFGLGICDLLLKSETQFADQLDSRFNCTDVKHSVATIIHTEKTAENPLKGLIR
jgi:hypothetical protein